MKKKIGFLDVFRKDSGYLSRASVCDQCGKEFLAEKNKHGKYDFEYCSFCRNEYQEHMKRFKDKKKQEMKEMYNQNYYDITEVKKCVVCAKEFRSNISNCDTCNECLRKESRRKKGFKDALRELNDVYYDIYPRIYECTCLSCGKEYKTSNIYYVSTCDECREERKEYKQSFKGRTNETDFKCIICNEYFKADSNKFICPKCEEEREKLNKVSVCKECGIEFLKKNEDDVLCYKCLETNEISDIEVCKECGAELFFGQVCNCCKK